MRRPQKKGRSRPREENRGGHVRILQEYAPIRILEEQTCMHHQFSSRMADMLGWDQTLLWMPFNKETSHKGPLSHTQYAVKEGEGYQSVLERNEDRSYCSLSGE